MFTDQKIKSAIAATEKYINATTTAQSKATTARTALNDDAHRYASKALSKTFLKPAVFDGAVRALGEDLFTRAYPMVRDDKFPSEIAALQSKQQTLRGMLALPNKADKRQAFAQSNLSKQDIQASHGPAYVSAKIANWRLR